MRDNDLHMSGYRIRRHLLTYALYEAGRELTIPEIADRMASYGHAMPPPTSSSISDSMRVLCKRGWARRTGRGRYVLGFIPRTSLDRTRRCAAYWIPVFTHADPAA